MFRFLRSTMLQACVAGFAISHADAANFVVTPPFKIQQAIDAALASPDDEDVIFVNPGLYDESLTVDFTGTNQSLLYLIHNTSVRPVIAGGVTIRDSRLVTFDGFEIRSSKTDSQAAAIVRDSVGAAFVQCVFASGDFGGVDATDSFEVVINACQFGAMDEDGSGAGGFGARIRGMCAHRILDSSFGDDEGRGIWIEADRSEIVDCEVDGSGGDAGIYLDGLGNVVKNSISKNNDGDGVRVIGTADLNKSDLLNNSGSGVRFGVNDGSEWTGGSVKNCSIKGNDSSGVFIDVSHSAVEIRGNTITSNSGAGVRLRSDGNNVRDNTIQKSSSGSLGGNGVLIESSADRNCVRANKFSGNSGNAVRVEGDENYVFLNTSSDSDGYIDDGSGNAGRNNKTSGTNHFD